MSLSSHAVIWNEKLTLLFIGRLSPARFVIELTEAAKDLDGIQCIIGGIGKPDFVNAVIKKCKDADNIDFIGKVPFNEVIPTTQKCDAVVCMIDPYVVNNKIATANKQFEAMVCGRPIICTKGTRSGEITENEKCGLLADFTISSLRKSIIKLRDSPKLCEELGKNALKAALTKYNWEIEEKKLLDLYKEIKENKWLHWLIK